MKRLFLVQRILNWDDGSRGNSIMNEEELIHYIDFQDICSEDYKIYDITEFGKVERVYYRGWQPGCVDTGKLIEFVNKSGETIISAYGTDH